MKDFEQFKEEVKTSPRWIVSLDEDDLKAFQGNDDCAITILEAETEDATEQRLHSLFGDMAEKYNASEVACSGNVKVLIHIQFPISSPLLMSEMSAINEMVDMILPQGTDCEVKWGLSPREDSLKVQGHGDRFLTRTIIVIGLTAPHYATQSKSTDLHVLQPYCGESTN